MEYSFLWHDYETFGVDVRHDRPAQFAAIRTDLELNEIEAPINIFCKPAPDYLPSPTACLITGITPQYCLQHGLSAYFFAQKIHSELSRPNTIGVGYNSIYFDDEVTRFLLWRNLIEPYGREWQQGCGRWDLLNVVRLAYALRPNGVQWPHSAEGNVSFRLEHLSVANKLQHDKAHDALSDVRATIALARTIKQAQPKLFEFALKLHKKDAVLSEMGLPNIAQNARPFLHVSGMLPTEYGCLSVMFPLAHHPTNRNEIIAWDLRYNPNELFSMSASDIRARLFVKKACLPEGVQRLPIKTIHINRSPMVVGNLRALSDIQAQQWQIDIEQSLQHAENARKLPDMSAIWAEVFGPVSEHEATADVDVSLYAGFLSTADRRKLDKITSLSSDELAVEKAGFDNLSLHELVWRYRARNYPDSLTTEERTRWKMHCKQRLQKGAAGTRTIDEYMSEIDAIRAREDTTFKQQQLLDDLAQYAKTVVC